MLGTVMLGTVMLGTVMLGSVMLGHVMQGLGDVGSREGDQTVGVLRSLPELAGFFATAARVRGSICVTVPAARFSSSATARAALRCWMLSKG